MKWLGQSGNCTQLWMSSGESKVLWCKDPYCVGILSFRSMNHIELVEDKQKMSRVNINILEISELKWMRMGKLNSDEHYIYYCGQKKGKRNGVVLIVNKTVQNAVLERSLNNDRII